MEAQSRRSAADPQTFALIGAAMEVHQTLGHGFLEAVYQEALAEELRLRRLPFAQQVELGISYKGKALATHYRADFVAFSAIIVELKALDELTGRERSQMLNYLRASGLPRGLLINFGARSLQHEWLVWNWGR